MQSYVYMHVLSLIDALGIVPRAQKQEMTIAIIVECGLGNFRSCHGGYTNPEGMGNFSGYKAVLCL